jgi:hypothetical protein
VLAGIGGGVKLVGGEVCGNGGQQEGDGVGIGGVMGDACRWRDCSGSA